MPAHIEPALRARIELLEGLSPAEIEELLAECDELNFAEGEVVIETGKRDQALYFLLEGMVQVDFELPQWGEKQVAELLPGAVFGEGSFFHPGEHTASVKCLKPSRVAKLTREKFDAMWARNALSALKLAGAAAHLLAARLQATNHWIVNLLENRQSEHVRESWRSFRESLGHSLRTPGHLIKVGAWF